jgi:D-cysteine desulfhydrase
VRLCDLPTAVERAEKLELDARTGPLYVKRDDTSARPYGGNKPRKLEWLLGRARARNRSRVMTFGALATNHGLATALYSARLGLSCELVLVRQPVDERVRRRILELRAAGARLRYGGNVLGSVALALAGLARHPRTAVIPAGGSSPLGVVGLVDAGLELAEQVERGELPEPARIYVALGTGGTAAGIAAGLGLAGLRSRVVGVLVTDLLPPTRRKLERLARRTLHLLARAGAPLDPERAPLELEVEARYVGAGYGHPTREGSGAIERAERLEGLHLDPVYTGKTLAALLARERDGRAPVLLWHSYSWRELPLELPDPSELPGRFRALYGSGS